VSKSHPTTEKTNIIKWKALQGACSRITRQLVSFFVKQSLKWLLKAKLQSYSESELIYFSISIYNKIDSLLEYFANL